MCVSYKFYSETSIKNRSDLCHYVPVNVVFDICFGDHLLHQPVRRFIHSRNVSRNFRLGLAGDIDTLIGLQTLSLTSFHP